MTPFDLGLCLVLGLGVGLVSSLLGVGGGTLMVPALDELFRHRQVDPALSQKLALATSLLASAPTSAMAGYRQHKKGNVLMGTLPYLIPGAVGGAVVGAIFGQTLQSEVLRGLFSVSLALIGLKMLFPPKEGQNELEMKDLNKVKAGVLGLVTGVFSALTGLGGGVLMVPALKILGIPLHKAVATSSATIGFTTLAGAGTYALTSNISNPPEGFFLVGATVPLASLFLAMTAIFATAWGVKINLALSQEKLSKLFGGFLILLSLRVGWVMLRG